MCVYVHGVCMQDLSEISTIEAKGGRAIITLIANVKQSSNVMAVVFQVMSALNVQACMWCARGRACGVRMVRNCVWHARVVSMRMHTRRWRC